MWRLTPVLLPGSSVQLVGFPVNDVVDELSFSMGMR